MDFREAHHLPSRGRSDPNDLPRQRRGTTPQLHGRYPDYAVLDEHRQLELCHRLSRGELHGGAWASLNVGRAFGVVMRYVCAAFYAHPWAWNEIGFGGPAYPRGYAAFGNPKLGEEEHWEAKEAFERDPVQDTQDRGLD